MLNDEKRQQSFPSLEETTYLNTAAEGIPPLEVGRALEQYFLDHQLGMDGRDLHHVQRETVKTLTAKLYGLSADEIGLCSSSSEAYNLAAMALQLKAGDEVVINDLDFPAGTTPWLLPTCPATVRVWKSREGALRVEDLIPLLNQRTRLVPVSLVSYYNGYMMSLPALIEAVRRHSPAMVAVDVTQALGRVPLNLDGVDLVISSTHKWILACHGGCLVGVPADRSKDWTVPAGGWYNLHDPFGPQQFEQTVCQTGAASFSLGMPNYPAIYAIRAALEFIQTTGVEAIMQIAQPLVQACLEGLLRLPVQVITPNKKDSLAGIVAFRHHKADEIYQVLLAKGIHVMAHAGRLRVSLHGYNTIDDVDRFLRELDFVLSQLSSI
jgi:cysteine desulfurase / selenocysteine lyase